MQKCHRVRIAAAVILACPSAVLADRGGTFSLGATMSFNLTTGSQVATGDFQFTGSTLTFQGGAKGGIMSGSGSQRFNAILQSEIVAAEGSFTNQAIPASSTPVGTIIGVKTNSGNDAKLLVTAISPTALGFQYTTFIMSITSVSNNSALNGYPVGIVPSSIVHVQGTELARPGTIPVLHSTAAADGGLPLTQNDTSLSITVGTTTVQPALYYSSPTDVAFELAAGTPTGPGTLTVTANGSSVTTSIQVTPSGYGFTTYNGSAVFTNLLTGELVTFLHPAKWGGTYFTWGGGIGADSKHSDTTYGDNTTVDVPARMFFGTFEVPQEDILFKGTLLYPGEQGFVVKVPSGAPTGCFVSVTAITGSGTNQAISNTPTIPITQDGSPCVEQGNLDGNQLNTYTGQITVREGTLQIGQTVQTGTSGSPVTTNSASATFQSVAGLNFVSTLNLISPGGCVVSRFTGTSTSSSLTTTPLDAGPFFSIQGPSGPFTIPKISTGNYSGTPPSGAIPSTGGSFVFGNGSGGTDIPTINVTVTVPPFLNFTSPSAAAIDRTQDFTFNWTGNAPGSVVRATLSSAANGVSGSVTCAFPQSAGTGTVPTILMQTLPAGTGSIRLDDEDDSLVDQADIEMFNRAFLEGRFNTTYK